MARYAPVRLSLPSATPPRPNVVLFLSDDQGYDDVGFHKSNIRTPHIDAIAASGVTFSHAYVTSPVCSPSRAGILTGRHQDRFGYRKLPTLDPLEPLAGLPQDEETLGEMLKSVGYTTGYVGKWHLGTHESNHPLRRGFDRFFGFLAGGHRYETAELTVPEDRATHRAQIPPVRSVHSAPLNPLHRAWYRSPTSLR